MIAPVWVNGPARGAAISAVPGDLETPGQGTKRNFPLVKMYQIPILKVEQYSHLKNRCLKKKLLSYTMPNVTFHLYIFPKHQHFTAENMIEHGQCHKPTFVARLRRRLFRESLR